jgi:hypothetical protein
MLNSGFEKPGLFRRPPDFISDELQTKGGEQLIVKLSEMEGMLIFNFTIFCYSYICLFRTNHTTLTIIIFSNIIITL